MTERPKRSRVHELGRLNRTELLTMVHPLLVDKHRHGLDLNKMSNEALISLIIDLEPRPTAPPGAPLIVGPETEGD